MATENEIKECVARVEAGPCSSLTDKERVDARSLCAARWPSSEISKHLMKRRDWAALLARLEKAFGAALDEGDREAAFSMLGQKPAKDIIKIIQSRQDSKKLGAPLTDKLRVSGKVAKPSRGSEPGGGG